MNACIALADTMRSVLGPRSYDKLIVDVKNGGDVHVSNDGATVLSLLQIRNPAARLLVQLSRSMDNVRGDGTTTVVVLVGSLLREARRLMQDMRTHGSVHPMVIVRGYSWALQHVKQPIEWRCVRKIDRKTLLNIATTTLRSKLSSHVAPDLPRAAVDALINTHGRRQCIQIVKVAVNSSSSSSSSSSNIRQKQAYSRNHNARLINSIIPDEDSPHLQSSCAMIPLTGVNLQQLVIAMADKPLSLQNVNLAVLTFPLDRPQVSSHDFTIVVPSSQELDRLLREEENYVKRLVAQLKRHKVNFVCCLGDPLRSSSGGVSNVAQQWLDRVGINIACGLTMDQIELICQVTGAMPITSPEQLRQEGSSRVAMGVSSVYTVSYMRSDIHTATTTGSAMDKAFLLFDNLVNNERITPRSCLVLSASSEAVVNELGRALNDVLVTVAPLASKVVQPEKQDNKDEIDGVVPGGGACEMAISAHLRRMMEQNRKGNGDAQQETDSPLSAADILAVHAFCDALEEIPRILGAQAIASAAARRDSILSYEDSGGQEDLFAGMSELRQRHYEDKNCPIGFYVPPADTPFDEQHESTADMVQHGVLESSQNKLAQITMATHMAIQIMKIDSTYTIR